jgi:hypothetical protein
MKHALLLLLLVAACRPPEQPAPVRASSAGAPSAQTIAPPSLVEAQRIIATSPEFSDYEFTSAAVTLPMKGAMPPYLADEAKQLVAAGWLRRGGERLELTAKAKGDKRFLLRPNDTLDVVPLASKELTGATSTKPNTDGTLSVDFTWKWIPNEVGAAFTHGPIHDRYAAPQKATARLMWDGSAWTVLRITVG